MTSERGLGGQASKASEVSWPSEASEVLPYRGRPARSPGSLLQSMGLNREHRVHHPTRELAAAVQEAQLQDNLNGFYTGSGALNQLAGRPGRTPGGQDVIHDQGLLAARECVGVNLDDGAAVLQIVLSAVRLSWQLAGLANRDRRTAELIGDGRTQDEAPGLDAHDDVNLTGIPP